MGEVYTLAENDKAGRQRSKAYGAVFKDSNGKKHMVYLNKGNRNEIIFSAGELLMLSGIGPAHELKAQGIEVVLSDNPLNGIIVPSRRPVEASLPQVVGITDIGFYIDSITSLTSATNQGSELAMIGGKVSGPFSEGYMKLQSRDPNDNPSVTFNYFSDSRDLHRCVQGMKILKRVVGSRPISRFRYPNSTIRSLLKYTLSIPINLRTQHKSAAYDMRQYCNDTVVSIWHSHGGCQVDRVLDRHYRVLGVDALRVVDSSTFYHTPGTNPQATIMMLGRYMGHKILKQRQRGEKGA